MTDSRFTPAQQQALESAYDKLGGRPTITLQSNCQLTNVKITGADLQVIPLTA